MADQVPVRGHALWIGIAYRLAGDQDGLPIIKIREDGSAVTGWGAQRRGVRLVRVEPEAVYHEIRNASFAWLCLQWRVSGPALDAKLQRWNACWWEKSKTPSVTRRRRPAGEAEEEFAPLVYRTHRAPRKRIDDR